MDEFFTSNPFLWLAIGFGIAHGIVSIFFFVQKENRPTLFIKQKEKRPERKVIWWIHQFFLNGAGAFIGWVALYYFFQSNIYKIGIQHFIALLIGFLGVTGYLPFAVMSLLRKDLLNEIIKKSLKQPTNKK